MAAATVLVTIPISHYCEKARWALDRAGVPYTERRHLQVLHRFAARRAGGRGTLTVPVLVCAEGALTESGAIVAYADRHAPADRRLYPADPAEREAVRELERDFDARLGPAGRLWMYDGLRGRRDIALAYAPAGVPAWQRRAFPVAYGFVTRVIDRLLDITPATVALAEHDVRTTFAAVAQRLGDGRPFLMGERFTAADLTFAALAASVLMPPGYGVPLPQPDELPPAMATVVRELREHPAGAHALAMFVTHRHT